MTNKLGDMGSLCLSLCLLLKKLVNYLFKLTEKVEVVMHSLIQLINVR